MASPGHPSPRNEEQLDSTVPSRRRLGWRLLRITLGLGLLGVILRWVDFDTMANTLAKTNLGLLGLVLLLRGFDRYLMAFKWNGLLHAMGIGLSHREAFRIYLASDLVAALPTGIGGEVYRVIRARDAQRGVDRLTASIVFERAVGILASLICAALGLIVLIAAHGAAFHSGFYLVLAVLVVAGLAIILSIHPATLGLTTRLLSGPKNNRVVRGFLAIQEAYVKLGSQGGALFVLFLLSCLEIALLVLVNLVAAKAIGLSVGARYLIALVPLSKVSLLLPITVGGIGVLEGMYVLLFTVAGLSATDGVALSLVMRVSYLFMLIPAGLAFLSDRARAPT